MDSKIIQISVAAGETGDIIYALLSSGELWEGHFHNGWYWKKIDISDIKASKK